MRLLIVDDHEAVRRGIRSLVSSRSDWSICGEAVDGVDAVDKIKELRPDIVLMDISMPRMDGVHATRIVRKEVPESRVIIVSQNDPAIARQQASESGAADFVTKGTLARDLLPAILKVIETIRPNATSRLASDKSRQHHDTAGWLFGGGKMGQLIREFDWSKTALGDIRRWPSSVRTSVNLMLNSQHPMWIGWGPDLTFLYNDAYVSVLSLAKHPRSLGRPAREVWAEIWDYCGPLAVNVLEKGEPSFVDDVRLFMKRGDYLEETYYSYSYSPIYDDEGKVAGLFCPSTETTSQVLHARRLRTLAELSAKALLEKSIHAACASSLATIATNSDDIPFSMLYLLDDERGNAKLEGTTTASGSLGEVAPKEILLDAESAHDQAWLMHEVIKSSQPKIIQIGNLKGLPLGAAGQPVTEAMVLPVTCSGQLLPVGILIAGVNPTRGLDTEYRTFFKLVSDQVGTAIQNAKAAEDEKKRADALAELDRAKTVFFSNVSHEFRTPLTLMLAPLEDTLAHPDGLSAEDRERLQVAHRNSLRLLKLVNTLLDFSRIESGRIDASYEPTDLSLLTADLASVFRSAVERAGLQLVIKCPTLKDRIYVDCEMWEKIVFNLLSNALKFTFSGKIKVSLEETPEVVKLSVKDTGTGIPAHELPHIFERFHRVKGARGRTFEGSGIGLALVRELAILHGGSVDVISEPERGTAFTITIPHGKDHLPPDRIGSPRTLNRTSVQAHAYIHEALNWLPELPSPTEMPTKVASPAFGEASPRARILLADDNADMREYVRRLLADKYQVEVVADGKAALEAACRERPDVVLTDVMMPNLDGFGLLKELRRSESTATVPVILLSARAGEESRVEGIAAGADDYLVKPFSARELAARVETHLKLSNIRTDAENRIRQREQELQVLHKVGATLASELDLHKLVQAAIDAGRDLSEAGFGAFFYNVVNSGGESYMLYAVSGAPPQDFAQFPMPRNTCIFAPTFAGEATLRLDDVTKDPRYGKSAPYFGMPRGHLPVRSYLAVPVVSRTGEVIGGLFYGHPQRGVFTERAERLVEGVAKQTAIAIDNARLFEAAKHARAAAQASAERLHASLTASDTGTFRWNIRTNELEWDENLDRLFGLVPGQTARSLDAFIALVHQDDRGGVIERCQACAQKGADFEMEFRVVWPDGSIQWLYDKGKTEFDEAGKSLYMTGACTDITGRKKTERQQRVLFRLADLLHRAESLDEVYEAALDAILGALQCARVSILLYDETSVLRFARWRGLSDYYRAATEGHSPWKPDAINPTPICMNDVSTTELDEHLKRTIQSEGIGALAFIPLVSRDKLIGKFMVYFDVPHVFTDSEVALSQNIARQLAFGIERKRAQQALVESRERFDMVGEASDLGFWFCDLPFDKLVWDHRVKEHFSLPPNADVTIQMFYERLHPDDRERTRRAIDEAIANNSRYDIEYRTVAEGGLEKWIRAIGRVYRDETGKPIRFDGVTLDITQKKLAEQALVASEERLRRLAENLDIEVRARTRELEQRNTEVIRQSERLRDLSKRMMQMQDEERRHIARELHDSAGQTLTVLGMRLAELVQESQVNAPELATHVEETQELVQQLNREIRTTSYLLHPPLLDETGLGPALKWYLEGLKGRSTVEITLEVADDFGRLPRDMELVVFRLVQECLTNIHRHSGSKVATVRLTRDINSVSLEVRDQGTGIPKEKLAQLQSHGSGVGIRGMRERVRQFRGNMAIESDGSGTNVLVTLPVLGNLPPNEELSQLRAVV